MSKSYWEEIIAEKEYHPIINGICYYVDIKHPIELRYTMNNGFGGQWFKILMNGKTIITNNLFYNSEVPDEYKDQLPNNAQFLENDINEINEIKRKGGI